MDLNQFQLDQRTLLSILLVVVAYYVGRQIPRWMAGVPYLKPEGARDLLASEPDTIVLDVRMPSQFDGKEGHIKDALNLPLIDLMGRMKEIKTDLAQYANSPVLLVCKNDQLSSRAARMLRKGGLNRVAVLSGGLKAWKKAGMPVEVTAARTGN